MQVREFERQAGEVREWDKVLVRNGNQVSLAIPEECQRRLTPRQITALHRQVLEAQQNQAAVDKALDYIEAQQKQLDSMMTHYEKEVNNFAGANAKPLSAKVPADREREKSYVKLSFYSAACDTRI